MKNSFNLIAIALLMIVMGCSCQKLGNLAKKNDPPPPPSNSNIAPAYTPAGKRMSSLSMEKYNQLKTGMRRSEAEQILGGPGEEISSTSGGGVEFSVNKWSGENYTSIILTFRDDKVMTKSQVGLK